MDGCRCGGMGGGWDGGLRALGGLPEMLRIEEAVQPKPELELEWQRQRHQVQEVGLTLMGLS
jgi:hypothetical protein